MQDLPHQYTVSVSGTPDANLKTSAANLPILTTAAPENFGGPGDQWSPEDLLIAAVANCTVLSFKAIARASKLEWVSIDCASEGVLDKVERKMLFTKVTTRVKLVIHSIEDKDKAEKLLIKAEEACLVTNSMTAETHLEYEITLS